MVRFILMSISVAAIVVVLPRGAAAQGQGASISFLSQRAFVTGFTPVIGPRGGVGGIDVDANGVLARAERTAELDEQRARALRGVAQDVRRQSPLRKVSLPRLEKAIAAQAAKQQPLAAEILFLAGLQRVEYLFVYPETHDVVIAGPAEGWVHRAGDVVGQSSGEAVLRLDDLLDVLQSTAAAAEGAGISCSIDPTPEGMARLRRSFRRRNVQPTDAVLRGFEQQLGDQIVTVTGVRPTSHFARVLVGADYLMKRLAMELEPAPVADLPSYMRMLHQGGSGGAVLAPRWWLVPDYQSVEKGADGLAWSFRGRRMQANSEYAYVDARGELVNAGREDPLTRRWAENFTGSYDALAKEMPVFSQLCGCVDLALLAAVLTRESLLQRAECPLLMLTDPGKVVGEDYPVAKQIRAEASAVRGRRGWVVSVSGGVDLDTGRVLAAAVENPKLAADRETAAGSGERWWWD